MTATDVNELGGYLDNAARDALETMCFYGVLGPSMTSTDPMMDTHVVGLGFHGDASGAFVLQITSPTLTEIAANFLGEDAISLEPEQCEAVACELANMLCGAALSQWQPEGHFDLGQPEPHAAAVPLLLGEPAVRRELDLEAGRLSLAVWLE